MLQFPNNIRFLSDDQDLYDRLKKLYDDLHPVNLFSFLSLTDRDMKRFTDEFGIWMPGFLEHVERLKEEVPESKKNDPGLVWTFVYQGGVLRGYASIHKKFYYVTSAVLWSPPDMEKVES